MTNGILQIIAVLWLGALFAWMFVSLAGHFERGLIAVLGCLGTIVLYAVLSALNLVFVQESDFLRYCRRDCVPEGASVEVPHENAPTPTDRQRPRWHSAVQWFMLFLCWLCSLRGQPTEPISIT